MSRDTSRGDTNDLILLTRDLQRQLEGRREANVKLTTENNRYKRQIYDLQQRLADIEAGRPTKKGEASSLLALKSKAADAKQQQKEAFSTMQDALDQNQRYAADIVQLQEDMQTILAQMDASKQDQVASEIVLAQERQLTAQLSQDKINLEMTMQQFNKAYDELEATKNGLLGDKSRLEQQLEDALKSAQINAAAMAEQAEKAHKALVSQHDSSHASVMQQSAQAIASKDQELAMLKDRIKQAQESEPIPDKLSLIDLELSPGALVQASLQGGQTAELNCIELLIHSCSLLAEAKWPFLLLDCLGHSLIHGLMAPQAATSETTAGQDVSALAMSTTPRTDHNLDLLVRLNFQSRSERVLAMLAMSDSADSSSSLHNNDVRIALCDLSLGLVGGLMMPGAGPNLGDMTSVQQVLAFAFNYAQYSSGNQTALAMRVELFSASASPTGSSPGGIPMSHVMTLSSDWRVVKTDVTDAPDTVSGEFVVNLQAFNPLQMEAARLSGLFMIGGRTFQGSDGATYQVWRLKPQQDRAQATVRRLPWQDLPIAPDGFSVTTPVLASTHFSLGLALASPSTSKLQASRCQAFLQGISPPNVYSPSDAAGTRKLSLNRISNSSAAAVSDPMVIAEVSLTLRLNRDLELSLALSRLLSQGASVPQQAQPIIASVAAVNVLPAVAGGTIMVPQSPPQVVEALAKMQRAVDLATSTLSSSVGGDVAAQQQAKQAAYRAIDALRASAAQLSSECSEAAGVTMPSELSTASNIAAACATLLYKQNLQWERTLDSLTAAQQDLESARLAAVSRPTLPAMRSRSSSNAGLSSVAVASVPNGSQTPMIEASTVAADLQHAGLQTRAANMVNQPLLRRAGSTESEDEEKHIVPLSLVKLPPPGVISRDYDIESDVASVQSASTLEVTSAGVLPSMRRIRPG